MLKGFAAFQGKMEKQTKFNVQTERLANTNLYS